MPAIAIPQRLRAAVADDANPRRRAWLGALPGKVEHFARVWRLDMGAPLEPGGQAAWVAEARTEAGADVVLKLGWRHFEAEDEGPGLVAWNGDGAVRCHEHKTLADTSALLLERLLPGQPLSALPEPGQDSVIAALLRRLWACALTPAQAFRPLSSMCDAWATEAERQLACAGRGVDRGLVGEGLTLLRRLPETTTETALLATDLHAGNVLSATREPWLAIDPKPYVGDCAYDVIQHMLNCDRLQRDPVGLAATMADLAQLDRERVRAWLFARCAQESIGDPTFRHPARILGTTLP